MIFRRFELHTDETGHVHVIVIFPENEKEFKTAMSFLGPGKYNLDGNRLYFMNNDFDIEVMGEGENRYLSVIKKVWRFI